MYYVVHVLPAANEAQILGLIVNSLHKKLVHGLGTSCNEWREYFRFVFYLHGLPVALAAQLIHSIVEPKLI